MFSNAQREQVKEEHPGLNFIDVGKKLGEMWREMDPALKKQWEERATIAKDQYLAAKKRWLEERSMQTGLFSAGAE
jgi:structure-specific recognition protein 1